MKYKSVLLIVLLFLMISLVSAFPDFQSSDTTTALRISVPKMEYYKSTINNTLGFEVHDDNGLLINNTTCTIYIYSTNGVLSYNATLNYTAPQFYTVVENDTLKGTYYYNIYCNTGLEYGWASTGVEFSEGLQYNKVKDSSSGIAVLIFFLVITILLYLAPALMRFSENKYWNLLIGRCLAIIATYLLVLDAGVVSSIARAGGLTISTELSQIIFLVGTFGYVLIFALFLKTLFDAINIRSMDSKNKRMGRDEDGEEVD